jgi:hypothetical protein
MRKLLIALLVITLICMCFPMGWLALMFIWAFIVAVCEFIWAGIVALFAGIVAGGFWALIAIIGIIVFIVSIISIICG